MKEAYRRVLNRIRGMLLEDLPENYETALTDEHLDDALQIAALLVVPELLEIAQIEVRREMAQLGHLGQCLNFQNEQRKKRPI